MTYRIPTVHKLSHHQFFFFLVIYFYAVVSIFFGRTFWKLSRGPFVKAQQPVLETKVLYSLASGN